MKILAGMEIGREKTLFSTIQVLRELRQGRESLLLFSNWTTFNLLDYHRVIYIKSVAPYWKEMYAAI